MKNLFYITGIVLILASAVSCKKDDGPVVDEGLTITAVKTRPDGTYKFLLKTVSAEKISTSAGSYYFYNWESCEDFKDSLDRLACGKPAIYGENYTKLVIEANKAVTAKVVSTNDSPVCADIVPSNDGKSFEVKFKSGSEGYGAVYILVESTDGASSKLFSISAYKTLLQISSNYPSYMYCEVWDSTGKKMLEEKIVTAVDNDSTDIFSLDSGVVLRFKGIFHRNVHDYDVHNYYFARFFNEEEGQWEIDYSGHLTGISGRSSFKALYTGRESIEVWCRTLDGTRGNIKPQYFNWSVKRKK